MKNKKGQIEDVFADLFPAMLIITIALFIISTGNTISRDKIEMEIEGTNEYPVKVDMLTCLLYTSPSPRDLSTSRMPSSA